MPQLWPKQAKGNLFVGGGASAWANKASVWLKEALAWWCVSLEQEKAPKFSARVEKTLVE